MYNSIRQSFFGEIQVYAEGEAGVYKVASVSNLEERKEQIVHFLER